jgi:hypothetical protein
VLVLGGGGDVILDREMAKKGGDFFSSMSAGWRFREITMAAADYVKPRRFVGGWGFTVLLREATGKVCDCFSSKAIRCRRNRIAGVLRRGLEKLATTERRAPGGSWVERLW